MFPLTNIGERGWTSQTFIILQHENYSALLKTGKPSSFTALKLLALLETSQTFIILQHENYSALLETGKPFSFTVLKLFYVCPPQAGGQDKPLSLAH